MVKIVKAMELAGKAVEMVECCKTVYGDKREERKNQVIAVVELYKQGEETLLSTAIRLCGALEDERKTLLILGSVLDSISQKGT